MGLLVLVQAGLAWGVFVAAPHPGGDNAGYVELAHALSSGEGYTEVWDPARPPHTKYPPVFPLLLAVSMVFGATGWSGLKAVTFVATLAVAPGVFLWARTRVPEGVAFAVALVMALSPSLLYHSHWVLSDVPFLAFTVWALWALSALIDRPADGAAGEAGSAAGATPAPGGAASSHSPTPGRGAGSRLRWTVATALVVLAAFTRSAGLPLAGAAVAALALSRRWRAAGGVTAAVGIPFVAWWLRGRRATVAEGRYTREFFLLDPYQPDLGAASVGDFGARIGENLSGYVTRFLPEALLGTEGGGAVLVILALVVLASVGWVRGLRRGGLRVAEAFLPLYLGVILLLPPVWSGYRSFWSWPPRRSGTWVDGGPLPSAPVSSRPWGWPWRSRQPRTG